MTHFKNKNKKSKSKFCNSFFDLKWKNDFQKISFIFEIWLMHWKRKHEKKKNCFEPILISNQLQRTKMKLFEFIFWYQIKKEFPKGLSFCNFCYEIEKWNMKIFHNLLCFEIKKWMILLADGLIPSLVFHFDKKMENEIQFVFLFSFWWRNWKTNNLKISRLTLWLFSQV